MSRKAATELFFLAVPTMLPQRSTMCRIALLHVDDIGICSGSVASFISAFLAVRGLLRYISRHDFSVFAWYRIVFGLIVIVTSYTGIVNWSQ